MSSRVLLLTQWFDPEPTFKGMVFARELVRQGFEVEVVTGFPNYPGGRLYPGYRITWLEQARVDGVLVTRVPLFPSHDNSVVGRVVNYVSFAVAALVYCLLVAKKPGVIYAYHPPLTVGIVASLVRMVRRVPVVYDIQDMWPDTLQATGMLTNVATLRLISLVCNWVYRHVDHIVVLSPGFKQMLIDRGVSASRVDVIYNWCDELALTDLSKDAPSTLPESGKFRIVFAGNMGKAQALDVVLRAAELLQDRAPDIHFILIGGGVGVDRLKRLASDRGLVNISFVSRVPIDRIGGMLRDSDALLVHLRKDPLFEITIPSKTQAYMAIGKPILMAMAGDAAALVRESECGVLATPEDEEAIAAAALALFLSDEESLRQMGKRGRRYYQEHLSLQAGTARFGEIFDHVSVARKPPD